MNLPRPLLLLLLLALAGPTMSSQAADEKAVESVEDLDEPLIDEPLVMEATGEIGAEGGRLVTADGKVSVEWAPNPARPSTPAKVWSMAAPGGAGFQVSGPAGPAQITCWPPGQGLPPGAGAPGAQVDPTSRSSSAPADGGVEILGPDQEWTTVKSELRPDGSRVIEIVDERNPLRKKGLVKGTSGPYILIPKRATVITGQKLPFKAVPIKEQQDEWKKKVAEEEEELAPITPIKKGAGKQAGPEETKKAPTLDPQKPDAGTEDDLAPIIYRDKASNPNSDDYLAPIAPKASGQGGAKP